MCMIAFSERWHQQIQTVFFRLFLIIMLIIQQLVNGSTECYEVIVYQLLVSYNWGTEGMKSC
jgi:hypothetical protein